MKKIYLAIPYSGIEESSYNQANKAMIKILEKGHAVYSPITMSHVTTLSPNEIPQTWEFWWNIDKQFIDWSEELWVLVPEEGFDMITNSRGVTDEVVYASERDKKVRYFYIYNEDIVFEDIEFFFNIQHEQDRGDIEVY